MSMVFAVDTRNLTREQWLEERRKGIGGSDAAAIAGMNKWKSPVQVYLEKIGQASDDDAGEAAYWGTVLEDVVAREFSLRTGIKVRRRNAILQHPDYPFVLANVDRLIVGEKIGLECKTTSAYNADDWSDDHVPTAYLIQCQWYMAVTGYHAWWIAVLVGGNKFFYTKIKRDDEMIGYLIDIAKDFWENHVEKRIPPAFDGSNASTELLKALYPESEPETETKLPDEADTFIEAMEQLDTEIKALEERRAEYQNKLKAMLADFETGVASRHVVTWKSINSKRFDSKRFRNDHPDLFEKYAKQSSYRRFVVKEVN